MPQKTCATSSGANGLSVVKRKEHVREGDDTLRRWVHGTGRAYGDAEVGEGVGDALDAARGLRLHKSVGEMDDIVDGKAREDHQADRLDVAELPAEEAHGAEHGDDDEANRH